MNQRVVTDMRWTHDVGEVSMHESLLTWTGNVSEVTDTQTVGLDEFTASQHNQASQSYKHKDENIIYHLQDKWWAAALNDRGKPHHSRRSLPVGSIFMHWGCNQDLLIHALWGMMTFVCSLDWWHSAGIMLSTFGRCRAKWESNKFSKWWRKLPRDTAGSLKK